MLSSLTKSAITLHSLGMTLGIASDELPHQEATNAGSITLPFVKISPVDEQQNADFQAWKRQDERFNDPKYNPYNDPGHWVDRIVFQEGPFTYYVHEYMPPAPPARNWTTQNTPQDKDDTDRK